MWIKFLEISYLLLQELFTPWSIFLLLSSSSGINNSFINYSFINYSFINYSFINYSFINYSFINYSFINYSFIRYFRDQGSWK